MSNKYGSDLGLVIFGDWIIRKGLEKEGESVKDFESKFAVGAGVRARVMGLPLKYDVGINKEKDIVASFGISEDFQV